MGKRLAVIPGYGLTCQSEDTVRTKYGRLNRETDSKVCMTVQHYINNIKREILAQSPGVEENISQDRKVVIHLLLWLFRGKKLI